MKLDMDQVCRVVNEADRAYGFSVGNFSTPWWEEADSEHRSAVRSFVSHLLENLAASPQALHDRWLAGMAAAGWSWGISSDMNRKTDPRLRPWEELGPTERVRLDMASSIVGAFARQGLAPEVP